VFLWRATASCREESGPGTFLKCAPEPAAVRIAKLVAVNLVHAHEAGWS
jgi:hypothetical protein